MRQFPQGRPARAGVVTNQVHALHHAESSVWLRHRRFLPGLAAQALLTDEIVPNPVAQGMLNETILFDRVVETASLAASLPAPLAASGGRPPSRLRG